jgi:hypothetical protein
VVHTIICNQKCGLPFYQSHFGLNSTGGKDYQCWRLNAPVIFDDNAGIAASCASIGVRPFLIRTRHCQHHRGGTPAYDDFAKAVRVLIASITDERVRSNLIYTGRHLRRPRQDANREYAYDDAADAKPGHTFRPVPPTGNA